MNNQDNANVGNGSEQIARKILEDIATSKGMRNFDFSGIMIEASELAPHLEALIAARERAAVKKELEDWVNVDTVPGIPIDPQSELERMIDGMRDRIKQLTPQQPRKDTTE